MIAAFTACFFLGRTHGRANSASMLQRHVFYGIDAVAARAITPATASQSAQQRPGVIAILAEVGILAAVPPAAGHPLRLHRRRACVRMH
ncbi:hypothetical protein XarjCFBP7653_18945 [Xanthomonas arboricola]|nr:hypothetical protein XarjCFBP7653_18945 [Xanthomonas arboricola]